MPTISLHFGSYRELAAGIAQRLLASRSDDALAPPGEEVIVASAGLARSIDRNLLECGVAAGASPAAVRTANRTIESFATAVVNAAGEFPRIANDAERRLAMRTAARAIPDPLMETRGTAAMLERTYRDVRDSGFTLREFAKGVSSSSVQNRERARTLVRTWEEYERLIAKLGCIDPADLLARATVLIRAGAAVLPQILAGFYDMTGAQLAVIDALRSVEKLPAAFVPVDPDDPRSYAFAKPFVQHFPADASVTPRPAALDIHQSPWAIHEYETREEEVRGVCRAVRSALDSGVAATDIGIVARSLEPYDVHLFQRFAGENGFTTTAEASMPLIAHRIGRAVAMLLRIRERDFPRSEVLEIVRGGLKVRTRINVDNADAETRAAGIAGGTAALLRTRAARSLVVGDYIDLVAELEEITGRIDGHLIARLADSFRIDTEKDLAACSALDDIADLFVRAEKWNRPADASSILDALEQVELQSVAAGASPALPTVWLGDVMRFRGRSFAQVFAVRLQDGVVPQRRNEDPLLLDSDRRKTGVREIGNGRDEEQLLFQLIRAGSSAHIVYSYASSDGFGRPLRPSHYLKAFAVEQRPEEKKEILRNFSRWVLSVAAGASPAGRGDEAGEAPAATLVRSLQLLARAGHRTVFDGYLTSPVVLARARRALESISPTQLEDFGECPQKFLIKHILRVRDIDDPEREVQINRREKGIVDHGILERFYRSLTADDITNAAPQLPRLTPDMERRLETIIEEAFDELETRAPAHNRAMRSIERRATLRVLRAFVSSDLTDLITNDLRPAQFEYRFGKKKRNREPDHPEPFVVDVNGVALRVEGTIDRVDRGDNRLRIVDYKSGKALRYEDLAEKIDRGVRLQLPLYAMAAAEFLGVDPSRVFAAIKPLARTDTDAESFAFALGEKNERLHETLAIFVEAILRGAFPAFPSETGRQFDSCKYCPVNHSCRTRHDAEQRRAVLDAGEPRTLLTSHS